MALQFAITSSGMTGVVQQVTKNTSAEIAEARDANGKVTDQKAYSKTDEISFEYLLNGDTPPEAGQTITVNGTIYLITSASVTESNTDYQKGSITCQKKDSATLVAYA